MITLMRSFCILLTSLIIVGCSHKRADDEEESRGSGHPVVRVKISSLMQGDIAIEVSATGKTDALRKEKIVSPIAGRIQTLRAVEGTSVAPGETLAIIQSKESLAAIAGAESFLQSARSPSQKEEARRTLALAQSTLNGVSVLARHSGLIATRSVNAGEFVAENAELATLVDLSTLTFVADVQLQDLPAIHAGQPCTLLFPSLPGRKFSGVLDAVYPQSDEQSQTIKVRIRFVQNSSLDVLRTEMPGSARIVVDKHLHTFLVPRAALLRNDETGTHTIVMVTPDSLAIILPVAVGALSDSVAEVTGTGLRVGLPVIIEGNYALADSTRVMVEGNDTP
jgi:multidrug efflux pump subunit AcrA (membrane-fusion protein)